MSQKNLEILGEEWIAPSLVESEYSGLIAVEDSIASVGSIAVEDSIASVRSTAVEDSSSQDILSTQNILSP
jgi:hypothetical protein